MSVRIGAPGPGDVFVTHTSGFVAWVIRRLTHSSVNHAGICYTSGGIIEADPRVGLREGTVDQYPHAVWLAPFETAAQATQVVQWSEDHLGVGYSFLDIFALFLAFAVHIKTPKWAERRLSTSERLICSQAVILALRSAGIDPLPGVPAGEVTPGDLLVALAK